MDPNETLRRIRELIMDLPNYAPGDEPAAELAVLFIDLDEWLSKGGFLPSAWLSGRVVINREDLD